MSQTSQQETIIPRISTSDEDAFDYLQSVAHQICNVTRFGPEDMPALVYAARNGDDEALVLIEVLSQALDATEGVMCLGCDDVFGPEAPGSMAILKAIVTNDKRCAALPLCVACTEAPNARERVRLGLRKIFPDCKDIDAASVPAVGGTA